MQKYVRNFGTINVIYMSEIVKYAQQFRLNEQSFHSKSIEK